METVRIELNSGKSHTCRKVGINLLYGKSITTSNPELIKYCRSYPEKFSVTLLKRSEEHTSELQSHSDLVCRLLLEKKK